MFRLPALPCSSEPLLAAAREPCYVLEMIRRLTKSEIDVWRRLAVEAIEKSPECFVTTLEEERAIPHSWFETEIEMRHVFVAEDDAGLAVLKRHEDIGFISTVYVRRAERGRGLADQLLSTLCSQAAIVGCRRIALQVFEDNLPAISLYRKHGFTITSRLSLGGRIDCKLERKLDDG